MSCRRSDMDVWRNGGLGARCMCGDVRREREDWRRDTGETKMEVWKSGGALQAWRHGGMEVWRHGGMEARCKCSDMVVWRDGDLETRCRRSENGDSLLCCHVCTPAANLMTIYIFDG